MAHKLIEKYAHCFLPNAGIDRIAGHTLIIDDSHLIGMNGDKEVVARIYASYDRENKYENVASCFYVYVKGVEELRACYFFADWFYEVIEIIKDLEKMYPND
jgi:hypothetical protein